MTRKHARTHRWLARWWVPLSLLLGVTAGLIYSLSKEPVYSSDAYVLVVSEGDMAQAVHFAQAYTRIAVQPGLITGDEQTRRTLSASASPDAPLIRLTTLAPTARQAAEQANQAATALILYGNRHSTDTRVRLTSFAGASVPASPSSPVLLVNVSVGAAAAVLLVGLVWLAGPYVLTRPTPERTPEAGTVERTPAMSGAEA
ncbi:Wzz/FepE/Etk N-terminal domain-containing protein [Nonomuraea sp. NPDC059194]|uniref:Wzz/FepE/Etk N-terminal domain-containing protein n=1 Tax=Nonomuraea sp. NPDC059194 TaxID=3346764 RepID=UPI003681F88A